MDKSKIKLLLLFFISVNGLAQNSRAYFSMPLEQTYFRRYAHPIEDSLVVSTTIKDERIVANDKLELFLASKYPNTNATHIQLFHKITSTSLGDEFVIIKFREFKDTLALKFVCKVFKVTTSSFIEEPNTIVGNMYNAVSSLKTESFRAFYNPEKTAFPAIDAIKARFKDTEGILDIDKLGAYLKTKPSALKEYCDF